MEKDLNEFIHRARNGDHQAFAVLMQRHEKLIYRILENMVGNPVDTQDVFQETFLRVFRRLDSFRFQSQFSTWVVRTAINTAIDFRRQKKWRRFFRLDDNENPYDPADVALTSAELPDHQAEQNEFWRLVNREVAKLPAQQNAAFVLRHYEGYKIREIADILQVSDGTVKNALFRAAQKLKKQLTPGFASSHRIR
ncbi:sigma-70 family RNA polymerase sigma factor [candidate division KSB1 bacterium]|nr:sigma-70 family RNA polymerase sigma factor [candidate division KSB1 bacterium]